VTYLDLCTARLELTVKYKLNKQRGEASVVVYCCVCDSSFDEDGDHTDTTPDRAVAPRAIFMAST